MTTLYDLVMRASAPKEHIDDLTKEEFGHIMHDPNSSEEMIKSALEKLQQAGGYENLGD